MWEPYVTLNVRNGRRRQEQNEDSSDSMISQVQKRHAEGLLKLLKAGVSMDYIKKHNCDNPFQPISEVDLIVAYTLERRKFNEKYRRKR